MISLQFTDNELQILSAGLGKLPYEVVAPLVNNLNQQIKDQREKQVEA